MRSLQTGIAVVIAIALTWLSWDGWTYVQHGYSLYVSIAGVDGSRSHIDFPTWRIAVHVALWVAAIAATILYALGRRNASFIAWLTLAAVVAVGISDVREYGTMGSPTSIRTVLLVLVLALLARYWRTSPTTTN